MGEKNLKETRLRRHIQEDAKREEVKRDKQNRKLRNRTRVGREEI